MKRTTAVAAAIALAGMVSMACSDSPTQPAASPIAGLASATTKDSSGTAVPQPPASSTPGTFHGTVIGKSVAGGGDTLATAPRLAGVKVTAYPTTNAGAANPTLGAAAASVTTGADGQFALPELPGGAYVVTFTPPAGSGYSGQWVTATAYSGSGVYPWWVVLGRP